MNATEELRLITGRAHRNDRLRRRCATPSDHSGPNTEASFHRRRSKRGPVPAAPQLVTNRAERNRGGGEPNGRTMATRARCRY